MEIRTAFDVGDKVEFEPWGMEPMTVGEILSIEAYVDVQNTLTVLYNVVTPNEMHYRLHEEDVQHASI